MMKGLSAILSKFFKFYRQANVSKFVNENSEFRELYQPFVNLFMELSIETERVENDLEKFDQIDLERYGNITELTDKIFEKLANDERFNGIPEITFLAVDYKINTRAIKKSKSAEERLPFLERRGLVGRQMIKIYIQEMMKLAKKAQVYDKPGEEREIIVNLLNYLLDEMTKDIEYYEKAMASSEKY
ncbi:hypothetical protein [Paenibacillus sp. NPDC057934]|uniref:hypothetical protein n=1 Tax=Paenibacillus sp. NPDC057934 TaxID=3346282 RepID=UPI0036DD7BD3